MAAARERDGAKIYWSVSDTEVRDLTNDRPKIGFAAADGRAKEVHCEILVGAPMAPRAS